MSCGHVHPCGRLCLCRRTTALISLPLQKLAHMLRLLGPCLEPLHRNLLTCCESLFRVSSLSQKLARMWDSLVCFSRWANIVTKLHTCKLLGPRFATATVEESKKKKKTRLLCCLGDWDWWSGNMETQAWAKHTRQPTRETTETETLRCDAGGKCSEALTRCSAVYQTQCDAPLQSWTSEVRMPQQEASRSAQFVGMGMRWSAVFVIVRFFCHSPYRRTLLSRLWFDLFREHVASGVQLVGLFTSLAELVVAVGAQATPTSRPGLFFVAEVRGCASCPFGRRLSSPCPVHDHVVGGRSGQEWRSLAPGWGS